MKYSASQILYFLSKVETQSIRDVGPLVLLYAELLSSISSRIDKDDLSALIAYAAYFVNYAKDSDHLSEAVSLYLQSIQSKSDKTG